MEEWLYAIFQKHEKQIAKFCRHTFYYLIFIFL